MSLPEEGQAVPCLCQGLQGRPLPEFLDVGGDPGKPVYPVHNAVLLDELSAALEDLGH